MAAVVTLLGTQTFNTTSGTHTVVATPAVNDLIILVIANTGYTGTTAPTDSNADGLGAYTLVTSSVKASSADTLQVYVRNSLVGSATATTFSHAPGTTTGGGLGVLKITGMSAGGASAIRQSAVQSNQSAAGTPTPVFVSAVSTNNPVIGAVFNATNAATLTPRSSPAYTERFDVGYATPTTGLEVMTINSGETASSIAWGGTSASAFCDAVVELAFDTPPTVALNSPANAATGQSFTPTLNFTGTDANGDAIRYEVQIDDSSNFNDEVLLDSYSESNKDVGNNVTATITAVAQSFTGDGNYLTKAKAYFSDTLDSTGILTAYLYAHSGTYGTSSVPTGSALATSTNTIDVTTLGNDPTYSLITFTFDGTYNLTNGTRYCLVIEYSTIGGSAFVLAGVDTSSPTHAGNYSSKVSGSWGASSTTDLCFYVYTAGTVLRDRLSGTNAGFIDVTNGAHTDPFTSGEQISYTVQGEAVDQQQASTGASFGFGQFAIVRYRGQVFTAAKTGKLTKIGFDRVKGSQGVKVYIDTVGGGNLPANAVGSELYSFVVPNASIVNGYGEYSLPTSLSVTAGTKYCFYLAPWSGGGAYTDDYADCHGVSSISGGVTEITNTNGVWSTETLTFHYAVYVDETLNDATFYWRVRATDPTGSAQYGAWSSTRSFTTAWTATVSDSTSLTESVALSIVTPGGGTPAVNVSDSTAITESVQVQLVSLVSKSDSTSLTENVVASFPLMETLADDFEFGGIDTGKWSTWGSTTTAATTNLVLEMTSTLAANYGGTLSLQYYNLTGSYAMSQLVDAGNQAITSLEVYPIELSNGSNALSVMINLNTVYARKKVSGTYTTVGSTVAYNSTTMKWFRVRESGGTTFWEYAADPTSTWTTIASLANPIAVNALIGGSTIGTWQAEASTSTVKVDNFNLTPGQNQFTWKGATWNKRIHAGATSTKQGWSAGNVSGPDGSGYVTIALSNPNNQTPVGSEIFTAQRGFGYGTYTAVIGTELDNIGHAVGFGGMFTFDFTAAPDYREIDVNETRDYGGATNKQILHSHVYNNAGVGTFITDNMDVNASAVQTHVLTWTPTSLTFDAYTGTGTGGTNYFHTVHSTNLPTPNLERVHFNIFVDVTISGYQQATPLNAVIRDFRFDPMVSVSDSTSVSENVKATLVHNAPVSDATTASESLSFLESSFVAVSDSTSLTEARSLLLLAFIAGSDSTTLSENVNLAQAYNLSVSDAVGVSEAVTATEQSFVAVSDASTLSENLIENLIAFISVSNATSLTENVAALETSLLAVSDATSLSENVSATLVSLVTVSDATSLTESLQLNPVAFVAVSDSTTLSENVVASIGAIATLTISVSDTIGSSENVALLQTSFVTVSDSTSLTEATTKILVSFVSVSDSISLSENVAVTLVDLVAVSDATTVTDLPRYYEDTIAISENVQVQIGSVGLIISVSDSVTTSESTSVAIPQLGGIAVSDAITTSDTSALQEISFVSVSDATSLTEALVETLVSFITVSDASTLTESDSLLETSFISVSDSTNLTESATVLLSAVSDLGVNVSDSVGSAENVALFSPLKITVSDSVGTSEHISLNVPGFTYSIHVIETIGPYKLIFVDGKTAWRLTSKFYTRI